MKINKILAVMCSAAISATLFAGCGNKDSSSDESTVKTVVMNSSNVKTVGRTYLKDDTLWLAMSGTGVDFKYTGKELKLTIEGDEASQLADNTDNYARIAIYVNGERVVDDMVNEQEKTYDVVKSDSETTSDIQVVKLSETAMSTVGIKPVEIAKDDKIEPAAEKAHKIEFIGDSITCGYGVDDENKNHHFSTSTEDVTKAYAYKTAQLLDADYSIFSISGWGIFSGYTNNGNAKKDQQLPKYYDKVGFSYNSFDGDKPQSIDWDFSQYQPEAVVINLGTNDDSYCKSDEDKQEEFITAYVDFLKKLREKNPSAKIFCTVGTMGNQIFASVEEVCYRYTKETGDTNITSYMFEPQNGNEDGLAADWHPTEKTHEKSAQSLAEVIKTEMGW